jgi:hypothetical protein
MWYTSVIPALGKLRQKDGEFKVSLDYIEGPCLIKRRKKYGEKLDRKGEVKGNIITSLSNYMNWGGVPHHADGLGSFPAPKFLFSSVKLILSAIIQSNLMYS